MALIGLFSFCACFCILVNACYRPNRSPPASPDPEVREAITLLERARVSLCKGEALIQRAETEGAEIEGPLDQPHLREARTRGYGRVRNFSSLYEERHNWIVLFTTNLTIVTLEIDALFNQQLKFSDVGRVKRKQANAHASLETLLSLMAKNHTDIRSERDRNFENTPASWLWNNKDVTLEDVVSAANLIRNQAERDLDLIFITIERNKCVEVVRRMWHEYCLAVMTSTFSETHTAGNLHDDDSPNRLEEADDIDDLAAYLVHIMADYQALLVRTNALLIESLKDIIAVQQTVDQIRYLLQMRNCPLVDDAPTTLQSVSSNKKKCKKKNQKAMGQAMSANKNGTLKVAFDQSKSVEDTADDPTIRSLTTVSPDLYETVDNDRRLLLPSSNCSIDPAAIEITVSSRASSSQPLSKPKKNKKRAKGKKAPGVNAADHYGRSWTPSVVELHDDNVTAENDKGVRSVLSPFCNSSSQLATSLGRQLSYSSSSSPANVTSGKGTAAAVGPLAALTTQKSTITEGSIGDVGALEITPVTSSSEPGTGIDAESTFNSPVHDRGMSSHFREPKAHPSKYHGSFPPPTRHQRWSLGSPIASPIGMSTSFVAKDARLSQELWRFTARVDVDRKRDVFHHEQIPLIVESAVRYLFPMATVQKAGSVVFGLNSPAPISDLDLVVNCPQVDASTGLKQLFDNIRRNPAFSSMKYIPRASTPIIKATFANSYVEVDIAWNAANDDTCNLINAAVDAFPLFKPVTMYLKYYLYMHGLGDSYRGGLKSFPLYLLVIFHLQVSCNVLWFPICHSELG